ncbi:hypothetical protein EXIGLDRAFT_196036 [Exidia glandulosa HHB12029]|uniref:Chitinase n=1 Tax=Exidia glandulosa HHB12029 TaxID=1314781 RepID=A0A165EUQ6_EXIGL|nr:hypothetical protein EXIGLDRAFT_196036 [Exidia glandulosa HHB12029]
MYDVINVFLATVDDDPARPTHGGIIFQPCLLPLCADGRVHEDEFIAAIKQQISKGKLVQLCIQWNFGVDDAAQAKFVETVTAVVDKYGFNGLEMMEFGFQLLDEGDGDFRQPTTPSVVNFISCMRKIKAKYGPNFGLTFSLSQRPFQFSSDAYAYRYNGSYLPVIHALRDDISTLGLTHNTDTLDDTGAPVPQDTSDYWVALADKPLGGFIAAGIPFPPFDASKVALNAALWDPRVDDAPRARLEKGLDCITKGTGCNALRIKGGPFPALLGVSAGYIQADELVGGPFRTVMRPYFDALAASSPSTKPASTNSAGTSPTPIANTTGSTSPSTSVSTTSSTSPSTSVSTADRPHENFHSKLIPAIVVPIVVLLIIALVLGFFVRRYRRSHRPTPQFRVVDLHMSPYAPPIQPWTHTGAYTSTLNQPKPTVPSPATDGLPTTRASRELDRLAALHSEMNRVGLSVDALQASLSRLGAADTASETGASDMPPPTYITSR